MASYYRALTAVGRAPNTLHRTSTKTATLAHAAHGSLGSCNICVKQGKYYDETFVAAALLVTYLLGEGRNEDEFLETKSKNHNGTT